MVDFIHSINFIDWFKRRVYATRKLHTLWQTRGFMMCVKHTEIIETCLYFFLIENGYTLPNDKYDA